MIIVSFRQSTPRSRAKFTVVRINELKPEVAPKVDANQTDIWDRRPCGPLTCEGSSDQQQTSSREAKNENQNQNQTVHVTRSGLTGSDKEKHDPPLCICGFMALFYLAFYFSPKKLMTIGCYICNWTTTGLRRGSRAPST